MSTEQNKVIVRQLIEAVINQNNLSLDEQLIAADIIEHEELPPGIPTGIEGTKIMFTMLHNAFPNFKATIHELIAEGDKVAVFMT
jgi:predicted SnoaL-like aldol condensation-catalyzing enzyme